MVIRVYIFVLLWRISFYFIGAVVSVRSSLLTASSYNRVIAVCLQILLVDARMIIQWIEVCKLVKLVLCIFIFWWNSKPEMVKTVSTCSTINAIVINTRKNLPKLVNRGGYRLPTIGQYFTEIHLWTKWKLSLFSVLAVILSLRNLNKFFGEWANVSKKFFLFGGLLVLSYTVNMVKICVCDRSLLNVLKYLATLQYFYGAEYFSVIAVWCLFYEVIYNYRLLGLMVVRLLDFAIERSWAVLYSRWIHFT